MTPAGPAPDPDGISGPLNDPQWWRRARSFGDVAASYDAARPGHSTEAMRWMLPPDARRVLDVGAGTGQLTRSLVAAGLEVIAVDPAAEMIAQLHANLPGVKAYVAAAEQLSLPDAAVDAALAGQAAHWFDLDRAVPELARVIRPGGRLGLVWNQVDVAEPWVEQIGELLRSSRSELLDETWFPRWAAGGWFAPYESAQFRYEQPVDAETLVALVSTRSFVSTMDDASRTTALRRVRDLVRDHPELRGRERFTLPYVVHAYRFDRTDRTNRTA